MSLKIRKPIFHFQSYEFNLFPQKNMGYIMELDMFILNFIWKNKSQAIMF